MLRTSLLSTFAVLLFASRVFSQSVAVPDYDFSSPSAPTISPYTTPSTSAGLGGWQVTPPPAYWTGAGATADQWYDGTGVFYNSTSGAYISNLSGSQCGYMLENAGLELSQTLSSTYQVGKSYLLTVGIAGGSGYYGDMPVGDAMQFGLFYMSGGSQTLIGTTSVVNQTTFPPGGYVNSLTDYTFAMPAVGPTDAWQGQNIGIALIQPGTSRPDLAPYWDIENVRLNAVPEPSSVALLLAAGLSIFGAYRRWSSKKRTL